MEVHHHPHVEKKRFKEYFLEFLMIFLAVTLGFFAENFREHLVNGKKEKEYIVSLKEDLLTDSTDLHRVTPSAQLQYNMLDSLAIILRRAADHESYDMSRLYYLNFYSSFGLILYNQNERTISQIKSTGAFNLIRNKKCRDMITVYYNFYEDIITKEDNDVGNWMNDANKMSQKIFNYSHIGKFGFNGGADIFLHDSLNLKLINSDSGLLNEYANKIKSLMMMLDDHLALEKMQSKSNKELIDLLNNEYRLEKK
ncbi:MAG TPA: hypothetical protein VK588_10090 [Chitinophagaceae bacterium]|nr:hypothetical protein [Chitinophagaceae bacterium]